MPRKPIIKRVDTKENVIKMVAHLTDKKMRGEAVCRLVGHSKIAVHHIVSRPDQGPYASQSYHTCARCGEKVPASMVLLIHGHNNQANRKKYREMTWRDKLYVSTPFPNPR